MPARQVGTISQHIAHLLNRQEISNMPVYLGDSNVAHMKMSHPADYAKYGSHIPAILSSPDYVGINTKDDSIELVKEFLIDHEYVKVAVRISSTGRLFARSLYVLNNNRVRNFIAKGTLKRT